MKKMDFLSTCLLLIASAICLFTFISCKKSGEATPNPDFARVALVEYINAGFVVSVGDPLIHNSDNYYHQVLSKTEADALNQNNDLTAEFDRLLKPAEFEIFQRIQKSIIYIPVNKWISSGQVLTEGMRICEQQDGRLHHISREQAEYWTQTSPAGLLVAFFDTDIRYIKYVQKIDFLKGHIND